MKNPLSQYEQHFLKNFSLLMQRCKKQIREEIEKGSNAKAAVIFTFHKNNVKGHLQKLILDNMMKAYGKEEN